MSKKVIVLSGVSGSGKSSYAKRLIAAENVLPGYVSADLFFTDPETKAYKFAPSLLPQAHGHCFKQYMTALMKGIVGMVIVDNTNLSNEEIAPYMLGAQAFGYEAEIVTLNVEEWELTICAKRNAHQVNVDSVYKQWNRLQQRNLPPWWKHTLVQAAF